MSKRLIFYLSCALVIFGFGLVRMGFIGASKTGQTNKKVWEENVRAHIATLFEQIIKKGDVDGAKKLLEKYEKQPQTKEADGSVVVKDPLKEFLQQPFGNYPNIHSQMPIQGVFYELAQSNGQLRDSLNKIALLFIEKTDPGFFTENQTKLLHEAPGAASPATSQKIPYLHFALKYGLVDVANALLNKTPSLANALVDGKSAFVYAYEGRVADKTLLNLLNKNALLQEADFNHFTDQNKKIAFLAWVQENGIPTTNATAVIKPLEEAAKALIANRTISNLAKALHGMVHPPEKSEV